MESRDQLCGWGKLRSVLYDVLICGMSGIAVCRSALSFVLEVTTSREPKFCIKN